jgi:hypothetical protein
MRLPELLVQVARRAKGRTAFEELDEMSFDDDWIAEVRAAPADDEVARTIERWLDDPLTAALVPFAATWAEHKFPRLSIGAKLASSLMATAMDRASAAQLRLPWPAMLVELPEDVVFGTGTGGKPEAMRILLAWTFRTGEVGFRVLSAGGSAWAMRSCGWSELGEELGGEAVGVGPALASIEQRSLLLARRVLLGICASLVGERSTGRRSTRPPPPGTVRGTARPPSRSKPPPPAHAPKNIAVRLPRSLGFDCRALVRAYALGERAPSSATTIHRGTWRRAADGGAWSWVEPYGSGTTPTSVTMRVLKS